MCVRIRLQRATEKPELCWDSKSPRKCRRSSRAKKRTGRASSGFQEHNGHRVNLPNGEGGESNTEILPSSEFLQQQF